MSTTIEELLKSREETYGRFEEFAAYAVDLKRVLRNSPTFSQNMPAYQTEALELIAHKIARILNSPECIYSDSWRDIAGYAMLVVNELNRHRNTDEP